MIGCGGGRHSENESVYQKIENMKRRKREKVKGEGEGVGERVWWRYSDFHDDVSMNCVL